MIAEHIAEKKIAQKAMPWGDPEFVDPNPTPNPEPEAKPNPKPKLNLKPDPFG